MSENDSFRADGDVVESDGPNYAIGELLALDRSEIGCWTDSELAEVCAFQLAAPLAVDLRPLDARIDGKLLGLNTNQQRARRITTAKELFEHPDPPLFLLALVKRLGKEAAQGGNGLPRKIGLLLYALSIACAQVRLGKRLTTIEDARLIGTLRHFEHEPWTWMTIRSTLEELRVAIERQPPAPADGVGT